MISRHRNILRWYKQLLCTLYLLQWDCPYQICCLSHFCLIVHLVLAIGFRVAGFTTYTTFGIGIWSVLIELGFMAFVLFHFLFFFLCVRVEFSWNLFIWVVYFIYKKRSDCSFSICSRSKTNFKGMSSRPFPTPARSRAALPAFCSHDPPHFHHISNYIHCTSTKNWIWFFYVVSYSWAIDSIYLVVSSFSKKKNIYFYSIIRHNY